jgi:hypothetical protein
VGWRGGELEIGVSNGLSCGFSGGAEVGGRVMTAAGRLTSVNRSLRSNTKEDARSDCGGAKTRGNVRLRCRLSRQGVEEDSFG